MSLQPERIPAVAEETARVALAAFPNGNIYLQMRDELDSLYSDDLFAKLYPADG